MSNRVSQSCQQMSERSMHAIEEHPMSATMLAFGIGFGVGVTLATVMWESASRKAPPRSHLEQLGRSVLGAMGSMGTLGAAVPASLAKHIHR